MILVLLSLSYFMFDFFKFNSVLSFVMLDIIIIEHCLIVKTLETDG